MARGIGQLLLESEVPEGGCFDAVVQIAAEGSWTRIAERAATG